MPCPATVPPVPFAAIAAAQLLDRDTAPSGRAAPDRRGDLYALRACDMPTAWMDPSAEDLSKKRAGILARS